jgi:hypothetical protein
MAGAGIAEGKPVPVVVATVTSAPGIADARNGIFRWYVRSEEESRLLARYLLWEKKVDHVGVFFIEHSDGEQDSPYGWAAMQTFIAQFERSGRQVTGYAATAATAAKKVELWISKLNSSQDANPRAGAFVVGYGNMLKNTVAAILDSGVEVHVACTSTLTGRDCQPLDRTHDNRIVTVVPRFKDPAYRQDGENRDIVSFFATLTLHRVLRITAEGGALPFGERWLNGECAALWRNNVELDQEHLANGDVLVNLTIAEASEWRATP